GALVGRLVDIASGLANAPSEEFSIAQPQATILADSVAGIRSAVLSGRAPKLPKVELAGDEAFVFLQVAETLSLIVNTWDYTTDANDSEKNASPRFSILTPDAFTNSDHVKFALKACLAATLCYILYNAVAWPGLSTAITTCLFTALSTVGASRQKQVLRL